MKLRLIPKLASNYQLDKDIYMKTRILLCAGLLAMGVTTALDSTSVMAKGSPQRDFLVPKNAMAAEKNAEYYKRLGNAKRDRGDNKGAIADYTRAIELNPNFDKAYFNRALAKHALGNYSGAIADYNKSLEILPNDSDAYNGRGVSRNKLYDLSGAIDDFNRALKINPNNSYALKNLEEFREGLRKDREQNTLDHINRVRNAQTCCK
jgi:tetratricopeptide (TPR) repeat protein